MVDEDQINMVYAQLYAFLLNPLTFLYTNVMMSEVKLKRDQVAASTYECLRIQITNIC